MNDKIFGIHIVATPIGNLQDISERAINTLRNSDVIICENPKHSIKLLNKLGIKKKLIPLHDYNENSVIKRLSNEFHNKTISLISDAGSPLISDPGYKLIKYCIDNNINITPLPGPTSIIPALQLSGLSTKDFCFFGFMPKKKTIAIEFIEKIRDSELTSVFFVSSHKLKLCLELIESKIENRKISISKEISKINEYTFRGMSYEITKKVNRDQKNLKGEFVVVAEGKPSNREESLNIEDYNGEILRLLSKFSLTEVVQIVHKLTGIKKNNVYKWVLKLK
tara:strand:+ start:140 stop:979 length:840 start_codon:yes stop_codon:yes gene_type:complete